MTKYTKIILILLAVVAIGGVGVSVYFYTLVRDGGGVAVEESQSIIQEVGKLIDLPEGEIPTLATVSNPDLLKNQAFFSKAEIGDKVLLYNKAQKAFLYRPSVNKLIEVSSIVANVPVQTQ